MNKNGQVLITGAVGGLGTAMVHRLLGEGHTIIACDRAQDQATAWLERIPADQQSRVEFEEFRVALAKLPPDQREALILVGA